LNLETGRVRKWRNNGQRQRGWRGKLKTKDFNLKKKEKTNE